MKIKENFVMQELADEYIVIPVGEAADKLHGVIRLNTSGAFIWKMLSEKDITKEELIEELCTAFSVDRTIAADDISSFLNQINVFDCLEP